MAQPYAAAGIKPPLEELLDDQIARLVMRRDGIRPADVWRWVHQARAGWTHAPGAPAAAEGPSRVAPPQPEIGD
jgi:hypothetical protein